MVTYMRLEEQVDADFGRARRRAILRRVAARLRGDPTPGGSNCFGEVKRRVGAVGGRLLGHRTVRLADIMGSVGRCPEFDGAFIPSNGRSRARWESVDRAYHRGSELPPVSLYKVDGSYFVLDGNHRVSVYRFHGVEWVDAEVTEFAARLPMDGMDASV